MPLIVQPTSVSIKTWLLLALVLNSGYLLAGGEATLFYLGQVLLHLVLGIGVAVLWGVSWKRFLHEHTQSRILAWALSFLGVAAAGSGGLLILLGNLSPQRPLLVFHIVTSFAAVFFLIGWLGRRGFFSLRTKQVSWAILAVALLFPLVRWLQPAPTNHQINNPVLPPAEMSDEAMGGSQGPFFPSAVETAHGGTIPTDFFLGSETCGRAGCHPDVVAQWQSSAHRFSSFNNQWYRKSIEYMQEVVGTEAPQWCAGCHDHALLFDGKMKQPVADFIETPAAHAGLGCVSCHSIAKVKDTMGNGGFVLEYPTLHKLANSDNPVIQTLHDFLLRLDPEPHRRTFLKPFFREQPAEYCSSCHKVHLDVPVNNYRWLRGFNEYDNWQASGVSGQGARSFYAPPQPQNCVTCHMPQVPSEDASNKGGLIRSHRFVAANTALPVANQDSVQLAETVRFLQSNQLRVDLFALSEPAAPVASVTEPTTQGEAPPKAASTFAVGEEQGMTVGSGGLTRDALAVIAPLQDGDAVLQPGTTARLDVVVRTLGLGHFFPGGTVDAQEAFLEVKAVDEAGRVLLWSGWSTDGPQGEVDPSAHFYRSLMVDGHANPINKRNAWASRGVVYVNLIPPGAADVAHYRLQVPSDVGQRVTITARLRYRKFSSWYTRFAYAGQRDVVPSLGSVTPDYDDGPWNFSGDTRLVSGLLKTIPEVPYVTLATDTLTLAVADLVAGEPYRTRRGKVEDRMRWNDYGIGLLLEGDIKGAEQAFLKVTALDPGYADGWINLARGYLQEGSLEKAEAVLDRAEKAQPGYVKTQYFKGLLHKARGDYEAALSALQATASQFPKDRVVLNQIGRVHYLLADLEAALPYFQRVLAIDPEDLMAHYNLMLIQRALGRAEQARQHEIRYLRFKDNEAAQALARQYREKHPYDNNEALPIHEHTHTGLPPAGTLPPLQYIP